MTQMSHHRFVSDAVSHANCATAEGRSRVARPLHISSGIRVLVFTMMSTGCVIPPSLSVDTTDAGLNAAPTIVSVRADGVELPEWKTVNFEQGLGVLNLTVYDTDLDDTLYPKVFVDYNIPDQTPARATCTAAAGGRVVRSSTCNLAGLCQTADIQKQRTMQVIVFDRENIEGQLPLYQAMPIGGLSTSRTYTLVCQQKQT
jgi:hypothetical protein